MTERDDERDASRMPEHHDDPLLAAQEHKGYGEDEGERDEALDEEADE